MRQAETPRRLEEPARLALREAGNRAYALSALESAAKSLLEGARALAKGRPRLSAPAARARADAPVAAQRGCAGARRRQASCCSRGRSRGSGAGPGDPRPRPLGAREQRDARAHYARSIELIAGLPETRTTTRIRGDDLAVMLLANEHPSLEEGQRILALAEELGIDRGHPHRQDQPRSGSCATTAIRRPRSATSSSALDQASRRTPTSRRAPA